MTDEKCGAECRDGSPCQNYPVHGAERCRMHGGQSPGAPEGNDNSETHGLTAESEKWFERHRDECEQDVRRMVAAWMELAPFGWEVTGNVVLLCDAAINECQVRAGDRYIDEQGAITKEKVVAGEAVVMRDTDNPAFGYKTQLQRTTLQILNKLNILDSPDSRQADALEGGLDLALSTDDKSALEDAFDTES